MGSGRKDHEREVLVDSVTTTTRKKEVEKKQINLYTLCMPWTRAFQWNHFGKMFIYKQIFAFERQLNSILLCKYGILYQCSMKEVRKTDSDRNYHIFILWYNNK